ncbi:hypothetical protein Q1695_009173 [Nippostrongylus brasiliensis]|nr:hypothetical protein Q1695_009173 [Nippostrongylus brasiliensis]
MKTLGDQLALVLTSVSAVALLGVLAFVGLIANDIGNFSSTSHDGIVEFDFYQQAAWRDMYEDRPLLWRNKRSVA